MKNNTLIILAIILFLLINNSNCQISESFSSDDWNLNFKLAVSIDTLRDEIKNLKNDLNDRLGAEWRDKNNDLDICGRKC